jgi:hypothetical protein
MRARDGGQDGGVWICGTGELNPNTANAAQAKVGEEKVIEEVDGVFHVMMGCVMAFWACLIAGLTDQ